MSATLTLRQADDVTVVDISGRITMGDGSSALHQKMRELVAGGRHAKISAQYGRGWLLSTVPGSVNWSAATSPCPITTAA